MKAITFLPSLSPSLERAWDYSAALQDGPLRQAALEMEELFLGTGTGVCCQVPWMGRGCFQRLGPGLYLAVKGVGPGPRSETMRQTLDARIQATRTGGCLRLETGTPYPLLIKFVENGDHWDIVDPRPEGFSMFSDLVRDAEAALFLQDLGVRALRPLRLLRHPLRQPWQEPTPEGLVAYLMERLPEAIAGHLHPCGPPEGFLLSVASSLRFQRLSYFHLDGGVLIRSALSPYRVANLQVAAAEGDAAAHHRLVVHMRRAFGCRSRSLTSVWELGLRFAGELARTAAALFLEGILHGQLNLHFQNITLAGEIADFDSTIFLRLVPQLVERVPFPQSKACPEAYSAYWERQLEAGERWGIDPTTSLAVDFRAATGLTPDGFQDSRLAALSLRQAYDFHVHAQRVVDLLQRNASDLGQPGTVLESDRSAEVRACFTRTFLDAVEKGGGRELIAWSLRRGYARLRDDLIDFQGRNTLYGWNGPDVPVQHMEYPCDEARQNHIRLDVESFFAGIGKVAA